MTTDMRDRLLETVRTYPGLHQRELARQMDTSIALVQYHAKALLAARKIVQEERDGTTRLYPAGSITDRPLLAALRDKRRLHILLRLLEAAPLRHAALVEQTGMGKSTLSFHLRRLEKDQIIDKDAEGFRLRDPDLVRRMLDEHQPTPDLLDRFSDLWGDLYG